MTGAPFTRRAVALLAGAAVLSLLATAVLAVFGDLLAEPPTFGADAWSRSAVGHRAFLELLRARGWQVVLSRHRTADRAREGAPTLLLEPELGPEDPRARAVLQAVEAAAPRLLVVLPKRRGLPDPLRPTWLGSAELAPVEQAQRVLDALGLPGEVVRPAGPGDAWRGAFPAPEISGPQLLRSDALSPLLANDQGMLAGEVAAGGRRLVVLADPDLLETHGLSLGGNAELAMALLGRLGRGPALVVDETLHGHELQPSLTRELLRFPLLLATLQALLTLALLCWAALVRFGRPLPPPRPLAPGKAFLVERTAELLRAGGHVGEAARAYLRAAREEVLARAPPPGGAEGPEAWLRRLESARGRAGALRRLEAQVAKIEDGRRGAEAEAVRAGLAIHRWREELIHGPGGDPRTRRGAAR
ncbi:MAG TPA: DUF4350 domain-containing protein [Anaeromyxobacter sp.]|nr:DUF4350 domain-containing protein [Anaeromyxobacter sp.]